MRRYEVVELMLEPQPASAQRQRVLKGDRAGGALEPPPPVEVDSREGWRGWTPLHVAAHCGATRAALALLKNGADPTRTEDHMDMTPAHLAAAQGFGDLLGVLESAAAPDTARAAASEGWEGDAAAVDREGRTPRKLLAHTMPPPPPPPPPSPKPLSKRRRGDEDEDDEHVHDDNDEDDDDAGVFSGEGGPATHDNGGWRGEPSARVAAAFGGNEGKGRGRGRERGRGRGRRRGGGRRCDIAVVEGGLDPADFAADYLHVGRPLLLRGAAASWAFRRAWRRDALLGDPQRSRVGLVAGAIPNAGLFGFEERRTDVTAFAAEMEAEAEAAVETAAAAAGAAAAREGTQSVNGDKKGQDDGTRTGNPSSSPFFSSPPPIPAYVFVNIKSPASPAATPPPNSTAAAATTAALARDFPQLPDFFPTDGSVKTIAHQLYMGASGSGAPHHFHGAGWNALAWGRKRWFMHPPSRARYSTLHPLASLEAKLKNAAAADDKHAGVDVDVDVDDDDDDDGALECTQEAGDVMFVPHSWGHAVINLVETIGVAGELATGNILNGERMFHLHLVYIAALNSLTSQPRRRIELKQNVVDAVTSR